MTLAGIIIPGPIRAIRDAYPDEARFTTRDEREKHFTPMQQIAWTLRFGTEAERADAAFAIADMQL